MGAPGQPKTPYSKASKEGTTLAMDRSRCFHCSHAPWLWTHKGHVGYFGLPPEPSPDAAEV